MMKYAIDAANNYISDAKDKINTTYRLTYHMMPPVGWLNDPNGLVKFGDAYHLYYQFDPYHTRQVQMAWGQFRSNDLISYTDEGVALLYNHSEINVFSGGAVGVGDTLYAYYTRHIETREGKTEDVCVVSSKDGLSFDEPKVVFDNQTLPKQYSRDDFRDPCPVLIDGTYYVFVGGKDVEQKKGVIIVLKGKTPYALSYAFTIGPFYELGDMSECPCFFRMQDKDVICVCGCNVPAKDNKFKNVHSSIFIIGNVDFEKGEMKVDNIQEIDKGDSFYAPQFIRGESEPVMIAWMEMWAKKYPTHEWNHGWTGAFTIPRKLTLKEGWLYQEPVETLTAYEKDVKEGVVPHAADMEFSFDGEGNVEIVGENGKIAFGKYKGVYLDMSYSNNMTGAIRQTNGEYDKVDVRVLLDVSSIELFVDNGKETISSRMYIDGDYKLNLHGNVTLKSIKEVGKTR